MFCAIHSAIRFIISVHRSNLPDIRRLWHINRSIMTINRRIIHAIPQIGLGSSVIGCSPRLIGWTECSN
jgi:hypothetical protein